MDFFLSPDAADVAQIGLVIILSIVLPVKRCQGDGDLVNRLLYEATNGDELGRKREREREKKAFLFLCLFLFFEAEKKNSSAMKNTTSCEELVPNRTRNKSALIQDKQWNEYKRKLQEIQSLKEEIVSIDDFNSDSK